MLPFRVQCVTCNARLKVNDPAVVGEVHSCPKCGSMVHLVPPPGWEEAAAATEPNQPQPAREASPPPDFGAVGDLGVSLTESSLHEAYPPSESLPGEAPLEQPAVAAGPLAAPAEATAKWLGLAIAGGGVTLFLATGLVFWLTSGGDQPSMAAAEAPAAQPTAAQPIAADEPAIEPEAAVEPEPAEQELVEQEPVDPIEDERIGPQPPVEAVAARPELPPEPAPSNEPTGEAPLETQPEPAPAIKPFDPLDFDPASLDLILTKGPIAEPEEPPAPPAPEDPTAGLDARLASNAGPMDRNAANDAPAAGLDARLQGIAEDARAVVRRGPTGPPAAALGRPLGVVIPEIQLADMPLERVCRLLGDIAGASVTLDPDALRYAGVRAGHPVTLRGAGESVEALFEKLLGPLRLEVADEGHGLVVSRIGARQPRKSSYQVDDLGDADEVLAMLSALLPRLRATLAVEENKLEVDGDAAAHMEVAILCERLRKARGLPARSRYPRELLQTTPALAELDEALSRRATFNFIDFTRLPEVFDHWRRTTGLVILVDGAALSDLDLTPATTIACTVNDRPWREALDAVLGELGLAWRAINGGAIQITTAAAAESNETVEFYPVRARTDVDSLKAAAGEGEAVYDEKSRTLIVRAGVAGQRVVFAASRD